MPERHPNHKTASLAIALLCMLCACAACRKISPTDLFQESRTATYMDWHDAKRVARALHTAGDRQCVKWENPATGYQYSAFVFRTTEQEGVREREVTLLTRAPSGAGESLDLIGRSNGDGVWHVFARKPAAPVGTVGAENVAADPREQDDGREFDGYPILQE